MNEIGFELDANTLSSVTGGLFEGLGSMIDRAREQIDSDYACAQADLLASQSVRDPGNQALANQAKHKRQLCPHPWGL